MKAIITQATLTEKRELMQKAADSGQFFFVVFEKKDKTIREMKCKKWVERHLTSGDRTVVQANTCAHKPNLFTVSDVGAADAFRNINLDTLIKLKVSGKEYIFKEEEGGV